MKIPILHFPAIVSHVRILPWPHYSQSVLHYSLSLVLAKWDVRETRIWKWLVGLGLSSCNSAIAMKQAFPREMLPFPPAWAQEWDKWSRINAYCCMSLWFCGYQLICSKSWMNHNILKIQTIKTDYVNQWSSNLPKGESFRFPSLKKNIGPREIPSVHLDWWWGT